MLTIVDFEVEGNDQVSIDWSDGTVEVVDRDTFLAWLNAGAER